jgi:hypothetical protein
MLGTVAYLAANYAQCKHGMNGKRTAISKRFANGITAEADQKLDRHFFVF